MYALRVYYIQSGCCCGCAVVTWWVTSVHACCQKHCRSTRSWELSTGTTTTRHLMAFMTLQLLLRSTLHLVLYQQLVEVANIHGSANHKVVTYSTHIHWRPTENGFYVYGRKRNHHRKWKFIFSRKRNENKTFLPFSAENETMYFQ